MKAEDTVLHLADIRSMQPDEIASMQAELSFVAGEEDMLQRIGPRIKEALQAPTHDANDYNCEDWPPGEGCSGCKGDEVRRQAIEWLATLKDKGLKEV